VSITRSIRTCALLTCLLASAGRLHGQPADTVIAEADVLARFEDARALAVDPAGMLYVVDAGPSVVHLLDRRGRPTATLGGPGTAEGQFNEPADIDPTNGLLLVVADAGNGRLQRFSRSLDYRESVPVGRVGGGGGQPTYLWERDYTGNDATGRPVAVVMSASNATYAIDADQGLVLLWDVARRPAGVVGGFGEGDGRLVEPVALAIDPGEALYVADRGRAAVLVYDLFGSYVRTVAAGLAEEVQATTVHGSYVWIVLPRRLLVYTLQGRLEQVLEVSLGEPLVDVALHERVLYLLTRTRLYRTSLGDAEGVP
jgi:hypothetical protein